MSRSLLNIAKRPLPRLTLRGVGFDEQGRRELSFSFDVLAERHGVRKLLVRLQSTEAFGGFPHRRRGPAQGHRGRSPSLHVETRQLIESVASGSDLAKGGASE